MEISLNMWDIWAIVFSFMCIRTIAAAKEMLRSKENMVSICLHPPFSKTPKQRYDSLPAELP